MTILDTHVLLWLTGDSRRLSPAAREAIEQAARGGGLGISVLSLWEVAWLAARRRILIAGTISAFLAEITRRTAVHPLTAEVAALAAGFGADYPSDPCDRVIGATALALGAPLVTRDAGIRRSRALTTIW